MYVQILSNLTDLLTPKFKNFACESQGDPNNADRITETCDTLINKPQIIMLLFSLADVPLSLAACDKKCLGGVLTLLNVEQITIYYKRKYNVHRTKNNLLPLHKIFSSWNKVKVSKLHICFYLKVTLLKMSLLPK